MSYSELFKRRDAELKARKAALDAAANTERADRDAKARAEHLRARKRENKRAQRERDAAQFANEIATVQAMLGDLPSIEPPAEQVAADEKSLMAWLATPGRSQGALGKLERDTPGTLMVSWRVLLTFRLKNEDRLDIETPTVDPGSMTFARLLSSATGRAWSKDQARRRLAILHDLEGEDCPLFRK